MKNNIYSNKKKIILIGQFKIKIYNFLKLTILVNNKIIRSHSNRIKLLYIISKISF